MTKNGDTSKNKSPAKKPASPPQRPRRNDGKNTTNVATIGGSSSSPPPPPGTFIRQPASTSPSLIRAQPSSTAGGARGAVGSGVVSATVALGGGIQVAGAAGGSESPSGSRPLKRKSEVSAPAGVEPTCSVCGKVFVSWKALFGHMRSHPERQWRGCFPPPVAQQQGPRPGQDQAASGGNIQRREELDIDLNQPQEGDFGADDPTQTRKDNVDSGFDLNMPPAPDDEDHASS